MTRIAFPLAILTLASLLLIGCGDQATTREIAPAETAQAAAGHAGEDHDHADHAPAQPAGNQGKVLETMDSGGYTYVNLDMNGEEIWVAGPTTAGIEVGKTIGFASAMEMRDFHAKSLDRTFDRILFAGGFTGVGGQAANPHGGMGGAMSGDMPEAMPDLDAPVSGAKTMLDNAHVEAVARAEGGRTVAEIYGQADALKGQEVTVRGRIVKFSRNIMGTNWMHIQDGTGGDETSDLTVTTDSHGKVGDVVLVKGPLSVDKDFGAGYRYHVIIEGASITKE